MRIERGSLALIVLMAASVGACAGARGGPSGGEELEYSGRVVVSGPDGSAMVSLQRESGPPVGLTGSLLGELTRLSGAVVSVAGPAARTPQAEGVEVVRYDVVSIDGERPVVGVLTGGGSVFRLQGEESVPLVAVPAALARQVGAKIWVIGPETGEGRRVRSYGVIRPVS